eukprot:Hpha_TRINITY_DN9093_c0_g1::TRINITY_DN9093_c0_g1_i1::g.142008::m.142008
MARRHMGLMGLIAAASAAQVTIEAWVEHFAQSGCSDTLNDPEWDLKFSIGDSINSASYPSCAHGCTRWSNQNSYTKDGEWCRRDVAPWASQVWVYLKGEEDDGGGNDCDHYTHWANNDDDCRTEKTCHFTLPITPWRTLSYDCTDSSAGTATVRIRLWRSTLAPTQSPTVFPTNGPTRFPSKPPTKHPTTSIPTMSPSSTPSVTPTSPTQAPTTSTPTRSPSFPPTVSPTSGPTTSPSTSTPTVPPSTTPTNSPTGSPTLSPSRNPTVSPTRNPTAPPTSTPTRAPTLTPTLPPTIHPCDDGSHGCHSLSDGGICVTQGGHWRCECHPSYWCKSG